MDQITWLPIDALKPNPRNARTHSYKQISQIAESIKAFGFYVPIAIDEGCCVMAGHGRLAAAQKLQLEKVPTIQLTSLSPAKKRALALADNKIAANAGWDREVLAAELPELAELLIAETLDIEITGFAPVEMDQIVLDFEKDSSDPADIVADVSSAPPVSRLGDLWELGHHRLLCGDARDGAAINVLMEGHKAAMAFLDPPYNVRVKDIVGRGKITHEEFAMGSGEMSRADFVAFLRDSLRNVADISHSNAIHYVCMDWRHISDLIEAGGAIYNEMLNLIAWVKSNSGQGSFYRSQHELIGVFRVGDDAHLNNVQLGKHGRNRTNVWNYPGANTFRAGRLDDLKVHPTVKPIALVCDAMKDCTRRGDVVVDSFCGSGTTILAAERIGRRALCVEIEPKFVDAAILRWQDFTKRDAVHIKSGLSFDALSSKIRRVIDRETEGA